MSSRVRSVPLPDSVVHTNSVWCVLILTQGPGFPAGETYVRAFLQLEQAPSMAPGKRRRQNNLCAPKSPAPEIRTTLPADLLLEVMARTDFPTLIRCTTVCKHLCRDTLSPSFIRRVTQQTPPPSLPTFSPITMTGASLWSIQSQLLRCPSATTTCRLHIAPWRQSRRPVLSSDVPWRPRRPSPRV